MKREDLPVLPALPGCYLFKDGSGAVIYVGKAMSIRSRVSSYFGSSADRKAQLVAQGAVRVDFIVTRSEVEALILEANLIKEYKPHFNVLLKDDKSYPFLKLTDEEYPMLLFTRRVVKDGGTYFGPYPNPGVVRRVQELIGSIFPLRQNSGIPMKPRRKPCLRYHMGRCLAPCIGEADKEEYRRVVEQVRAFLEGRVEDTAQMLEKEMQAAAARRDFELARVYRDRLQALRRMTGFESDVSRNSEEDLDFLGLAQAGNYAMVQLFQMRRGRVVGHDKRFLTNAAHAGRGEVLERFMSEFYSQAMQVPPLILLPPSDLEVPVWGEFLAERAGRKVELRVPRRGDKLELMRMAERNARTGVESEIALLERRGEAPGVAELQQLLALDSPPYRIEGYDISNLMGTHTVGSIVVFEGGRARRSEYRKVRIRELEKPDDFFSMHQAVSRRFTGGLADKMALPDLLLIDGGKGQLSAARRALDEAGLDIPLVGLAKRQETLIMANGEELVVPLSHPGLKLLINVRDEAHRIAVGYNRARRGKAMTSSLLDEVPGIGPKRRDALLAHFSSIEQLQRAEVAEIASIPGVGSGAANAVKAFFNEEAGE